MSPQPSRSPSTKEKAQLDSISLNKKVYLRNEEMPVVVFYLKYRFCNLHKKKSSRFVFRPSPIISKLIRQPNTSDRFARPKYRCFKGRGAQLRDRRQRRLSGRRWQRLSRHFVELTSDWSEVEGSAHHTVSHGWTDYLRSEGSGKHDGGDLIPSSVDKSSQTNCKMSTGSLRSESDK